MKNNHLILLIVILLVYLAFDMFVPFGDLILYPINLFVTFLHEFGHALGAIVTGGDVSSLQVNSDGSGVTYTSGGSRTITIMGGYIGSAIFGNLLLYLGIKKSGATKIVMFTIAVLMVISSLAWFSSIFNLVFILIFATALMLISKKEIISKYILMFLGGASVLHIISDFNVGPSSDLNAYAQVMGMTQVVWMYIWLGIVVGITYLNVKLILINKK